MFTKRQRNFIKTIHDKLDSLGLGYLINLCRELDKSGNRLDTNGIYCHIAESLLKVADVDNGETTTSSLDELVPAISFLLSDPVLAKIYDLIDNVYSPESRYFDSLKFGTVDRLETPKSVEEGFYCFHTEIFGKKYGPLPTKRGELMCQNDWVDVNRVPKLQTGFVGEGTINSFKHVFDGNEKNNILVTKSFFSNSYSAKDSFGNRVFKFINKNGHFALDKCVLDIEMVETKYNLSNCWGHVNDASRCSNIYLIKNKAGDKNLCIFQVFKFDNLPSVKKFKIAMICVMDMKDLRFVSLIPFLSLLTF